MSKGNEITISKGYVHPHVHSSVIYKSRDMETAQASVEQMDKDMILARPIDDTVGTLP